MGNTYGREDSVESSVKSAGSRRSSFLRRCKSSKTRDAESLRGYSEEEADGGRREGEEGEKHSEAERRRLLRGKTLDEQLLRRGEVEDREWKDKEEEEEEEEEEPPLELTEEQKETVKKTWLAIEANVARVGVVLFMGLFETHPDVQEVFIPFRGLPMEEVQQSKALRAHALRVMGFVDKAVRRLDEPHKLVPLIQECGRNHTRYGAQVQHVQLVGPEFLKAIRPALGDEWTPEVEEAWKLLLNNIAYVMKQAMRDTLKKQQEEAGGD